MQHIKVHRGVHEKQEDKIKEERSEKHVLYSFLQLVKQLSYSIEKKAKHHGYTVASWNLRTNSDIFCR